MATDWRLIALLAIAAALPFGCAQQTTGTACTTAATSQPVDEDDIAIAKPIQPRDRLERLALNRGAGLKSVDRMMDQRTAVPPFDRQPLTSRPADQKIGDDVSSLPDESPFPESEPLPPKEANVTVAIGRSTYRTREREEVLSVVQPFIDITQRDVAVRGTPVLYESAEELRDAALSGQAHMMISHVFEYLMVRRWLEKQPDNGTILLCWAGPAHPRTTDLDAGQRGVPGTSVEIVVAGDSRFQQPTDLKGARLALAANYVDAPGAFLTRTLLDMGIAPGQQFFSSVTLRRYPKDAVIDVIKGKADVACVDQGTIGAMVRFYGIESRIRTIAVSPRYNLDVLFTTQNNVATHQTEIELTQRQITTLEKDAEGQEVLFLFDEAAWHNYEEGDIAVAREHFDDYLAFRERTPVDLKPLLDSNAPVDRKTYDRLGDE